MSLDLHRMLILSIQKKEGGLLFLESFKAGKQIWTRAKSRKKHKCVLCRQWIKRGATMYRPMTNKKNRYVRCCEACIEKALQNGT